MELLSRFVRDAAKAAVCDWFVGLGSDGSSTDSYMKQYAERANIKVYPIAVDDDSNAKRVFVSLDANQPNRIPFIMVQDHVDHALAHGMTLVADNSYHRNRSYNVSEREFADYMQQFIDNGSYTYHDHVSYGVYTATF